MKTERHPRNAPGPFYVENGCCISCMVPHLEAPALMGYDEDEGHCFIQQQPMTAEEVYRAIRAVWISCVQCIRYADNDPEILRRMAEIGAASACDHPPPPGATCVLRNYVTYQAPAAVTRLKIAAALRRHLDSGHSHYSDYRTTPLVDDGQSICFSISWYQDEFYAFRVAAGEPGTGHWLIHHSPVMKPGSISLSVSLDDWLRTNPDYTDIRWYTAEQWRGGRVDWQSLPY